MSKQFAITTSDNPFNPIEKFDAWYEFDEEKGYHSCQYLARMAHTSDCFSDALNEEIIEEAIDDIVKRNIIGLLTGYEVNYLKVTA